MTAQITMTPEEMAATIARLTAENARLKTAHAGKLSCKVTEKGAVSVYGLGRFPTTLYRSQWERLLGAKEAIEAFIAANANLLSVKGE